ncbi:MAG: hypothetical protein HY808_14745 [Nitrospirae bacterium]|nr:hypothetical protein [Nitrospirota bacterium]
MNTEKTGKKTFIFELAVSAWIVLHLFFWFVLNGYPDLSFKNQLPFFMHSTVEKAHDTIWPYVWRPYIWSENSIKENKDEKKK